MSTNQTSGSAGSLGRDEVSSLSPPGGTARADIDRSCGIPLLALFGGAALWLVVGSVFSLLASINFHAPDLLADCAWLSYGRLQPAADDALLYGFCLPAGLGVVLWLLARLGQIPLRGASVPIFAANLWHLGVFVGLLAIFIGDSTGFTWLEFPRGGSVPIFFAYLLLALWAMMIFAGRCDRTLYPSHWFLIAALFWFPWIYSVANLFLVAWPVRGVVQAIIGWWFANNLTLVWTGLMGLGVVLYFLPKLSGRPLQSHYLALFAFWTFILFGTWCGVPAGAPVPAWLPTISTVAAALLLVPLIILVVMTWRTVGFIKLECLAGGSYAFVRLGLGCFRLSLLLLIVMACPHLGRVLNFTWFVPAETQLRLYGFFALTMFGAIYYLLPRAVGIEFPFPRLVRVHFWLSLAGIVLLVAPLAVGGVVQGLKLQDPDLAFSLSTQATLPFLRISTLGLVFMLLGNLLFFVNIMGLTLRWKFALAKKFIAFVKSPLAMEGAKS